LTSGAFFEPFNVSHWEYLSVQRVKDNLEKRQKASADLLRELMEPRGKLERDLHPHDTEGGISTKIWSVLKDLSPGFYNSFSSYMIPSEEETAEVVFTEASSTPVPPPSPSPSSSPNLPGLKSALPPSSTNVAKLPRIRKVYDLRPYGFNMVVDFSWSR
jgi:hypothetical protein